MPRPTTPPAHFAPTSPKGEAADRLLVLVKELIQAIRRGENTPHAELLRHAANIEAQIAQYQRVTE